MAPALLHGHGPLHEGHRLRKSGSKPRPSLHLTKHTKFMRNLIRKAYSFMPCEHCTMELQIKVPRETSMLTFIKKSVGTHINAKTKCQELSNVLWAMRKATAKKD